MALLQRNADVLTAQDAANSLLVLFRADRRIKKPLKYTLPSFATKDAAKAFALNHDEQIFGALDEWLQTKHWPKLDIQIRYFLSERLLFAQTLCLDRIVTNPPAPDPTIKMEVIKYLIINAWQAEGADWWVGKAYPLFAHENH